MNNKLSLSIQLILYTLFIMFLYFSTNVTVSQIFRSDYYNKEIATYMHHQAEILQSEYPNIDDIKKEIIAANINFEIYDTANNKITYSSSNRTIENKQTSKNINTKEVLDGYIEESENGLIKFDSNKEVHNELNVLIENNEDKCYFLYSITDSIYVIMHISVPQIENIIDVSNRLSWASFIFTAVITVPISGLVAFWVSRKANKLKKHIQSIVNHDFCEMHEQYGIKEFDEVKATIDSMGSEISQQIITIENQNKELQNNLNLKEMLEERQKTFISDVSHEIKTPISIIHGYAEGIKLGLPESKEETEEYCQLIMNECDRLNKMVQQLISLSKMENAEIVLTCSCFDILEIVKGIKNRFQNMCQEQNIEIEIDLPKEQIIAYADEMIIEDIISNYVENAYKYCEKPGHILIKVIPGESDILVSVFNNGKGFSEDEKIKIWDRFFKIDKARTRNTTSTGIGLSVVKAYMQKYDMPYGVNNVDGGVEFFIKLKKGDNYGK